MSFRADDSACSVTEDSTKVKSMRQTGSVPQPALMTASLFSGKIENLRVAVQDRLHQPYRSGLIEHYDQVFRISYELGSLGTYVSGAGPTIIALVPSDEADNFLTQIQVQLAQKGIENWKTEILAADSHGARITVE